MPTPPICLNVPDVNIFLHFYSQYVKVHLKENAAASIDRGIAKTEVSESAKEEKQTTPQELKPYIALRRRPSSGYLKEIKPGLWEGRYSPVWPDGKKHSRNVYGHTKEECEAKLKELIIQMKAEIAALRSGKTTEYPDGVSTKKKQLAAYLRENPGVSNKSYIARQLGMTITTVHKYCGEVRADLAANLA